MSGHTIALQDGNALRKITKIVPYKKGGFAVLAPYHRDRRGYLAKHPVDYSERVMNVRRDDMVEYSAEDRVKLSLHPDGFAQFSGENPGKIVSGRDAETGEPKDLGLSMSQPLYASPNTGPTLACVVWGVSDFEAVGGVGGSDVVAFSDEDFYYRNCTPETWNGYAIEVFVLPESYWRGVRCRGGRLTMSLMPMFEAVGAVFDFRVVPLPGQPILLGLLVSRLRTSFLSPSGLSLNSPSDLEHALLAVYPSPEVENRPALSLDHER